MLAVAISPFAIPLLVKAARTAAAEVDVLASASLFDPATTETLAFNRTASGVTLIEPSEFTVTYRVAVVAALAGKESAAPPIKVRAVTNMAILRKGVVVMA
jgi:hypothetical protein